MLPFLGVLGFSKDSTASCGSTPGSDAIEWGQATDGRYAVITLRNHGANGWLASAMRVQASCAARSSQRRLAAGVRERIGRPCHRDRTLGEHAPDRRPAPDLSHARRWMRRARSQRAFLTHPDVHHRVGEARHAPRVVALPRGGISQAQVVSVHGPRLEGHQPHRRPRMSRRGVSRATRTEAARRQDAQRCNRDQVWRHNSSTPRGGRKFRGYDRNDQATALVGDAGCYRQTTVHRSAAGATSRARRPSLRPVRSSAWSGTPCTTATTWTCSGGT